MFKDTVGNKLFNFFFFSYFMDTKLLNSYILFKKNKKGQAFHIFKQKLAKEIIAIHLKNKGIREISSISDSIKMYTIQHFPKRITP